MESAIDILVAGKLLSISRAEPSRFPGPKAGVGAGARSARVDAKADGGVYEAEPFQPNGGAFCRIAREV